jgi:hypothetical protein
MTNYLSLQKIGRSILFSSKKTSSFYNYALLSGNNYYQQMRLKSLGPVENNKPILSPNASARTISSINIDALNLSDSNNLKNLNLKFEDGETAFRSKKFSELLRSLFVFQLCTIKPLIRNQDKVNIIKIYILK